MTTEPDYVHQRTDGFRSVVSHWPGGGGQGLHVDVEAEGFELGDGAGLGLGWLSSGVVVGAGIAVEITVGEHVPGGDEHCQEPGAVPAQEARWAAVGNTIMSAPVSARNTSATLLCRVEPPLRFRMVAVNPVDVRWAGLQRCLYGHATAGEVPLGHARPRRPGP